MYRRSRETSESSKRLHFYSECARDTRLLRYCIPTFAASAVCRFSRVKRILTGAPATFPPKRGKFLSQITHSIIAAQASATTIAHTRAIEIRGRFANVGKHRTIIRRAYQVSERKILSRVHGAPRRRATIASDECSYTFT